jgi:AraC family transcriptional regulator, regulatory protein of adaptative response / methylated-DNA-[protein]-cysteine methyltransferase
MPETIRYAWGPSSLGEFLCAASACGLVSLEFGKRDSALAAILQRRFPGAALVEDPATLQEVVEKAASLIEHPAQHARLPVDLRGSDFERQVWCTLQEVPAGGTTSYGELASRLGVPRLAKEVGEACASNSIAVVIPCHRVLRKDGSLSGYRWGTWRKRTLLERECLENFTLS